MPFECVKETLPCFRGFILSSIDGNEFIRKFFIHNVSAISFSAEAGIGDIVIAPIEGAVRFAFLDETISDLFEENIIGLGIAFE